MGRFHEAAIVAKTALEAFKNSNKEDHFHFHLANIYGKQNLFAQAESHYKTAIELNPRNALYYANFGVLYHRWKKMAEAEKCYKKALELDPKHKSAQMNLKNLMHK